MAGLLDSFWPEGDPATGNQNGEQVRGLVRKAIGKTLGGKEEPPIGGCGQLNQMESTKRTVGICRTRAGAGNSEEWPTLASYSERAAATTA